MLFIHSARRVMSAGVETSSTERDKQALLFFAKSQKEARKDLRPTRQTEYGARNPQSRYRLTLWFSPLGIEVEIEKL